MKRTGGLVKRFALLLTAFIIITIIFSSAATFASQNNEYRAQKEARIKEVTRCLTELITDNGDEFKQMQEYFLENHEKIIIPYDYDGNYIPARDKWLQICSEQYGGETLGKNLSFDDLSEEAKLAFATYKYEQWLSTFESFNDNFGTEYVYYLVPTDTPPLMYYVFDGLRTEKVVDGKSIMEFDYDVQVPVDQYPKLWETYWTGKSPDGYEVYDNQFGKTYGYFTPLYVDGELLGIVCADINVDNVNKEILANTLKEVLLLTIILVITMFTMLWAMNKQYIRKLHLMEDYMYEYTEKKDAAIAEKFDKLAGRNHEITNLAVSTASMIRELDDYMQNLNKTSKELDSTKIQAERMSELANKDALTGIRNKNAYDTEIGNLDWDLKMNPNLVFGLAMIDLNFLKMINDTYGHEKGNYAIKKLCMTVCNIFSHSPVFRIGGDEFVVILKGTDFENRDELLNQFHGMMEAMQEDAALSPWEKISAAIGVAIYDPNIDNSIDNVFKRADSLMYENKKAMKAARE